VTVDGECGGSWYLFRGEDDEMPFPWRLIAAPQGREIASATLPQEVAWRVFTKGISRADALRALRVRGDARLGGHLLTAVAIVG
jgi:hypothetical protein